MNNEPKKIEESFLGRTVVVTGATGFLGRELCLALAKNKANLAIIDLDQEKLKDLSNDISNRFSVKTKSYPCDISNPTLVSSTVLKIAEDFGGIDVLYNNAASKSRDLKKFVASFEDYSFETWREVMSVNIDGMFLMAQAVGIQMKKNPKGGVIIQTSSIYGVMAPDQRIYEGVEYMGAPMYSPAVYSASKAAVIGLTKFLSAYWAKDKIRVNTITPGGIENSHDQKFVKAYSNRVPMGRMADVQEMLGAFLFLASDSASYITGQNLMVDGGLNAW